MTATAPQLRPRPPAPAGGSWSFLRSPRWIAGHVLVLVLLVLFTSLGLWQLRRNDERQAFNALLTDRMAAAPTAAEAVLAGDPADAAWRPVVARGSYRVEQEVLVGPTSQKGRPAFGILTPLSLETGGVLWVHRGWVPFEADLEPPVAGAAPPAGTVTVTGLLRESQAASGQGSRQPDGDVRVIARPDLRALEGAAGEAAHPVWLLRTDQVPPDPAEWPRPSPVPDASDAGPHLVYAGQWFLFAAVGAIGYPLLLRRTAARSRPS